MVSNGEEANGLNNFSFSGRLVDNSGSSVTSGVSLVFTNYPSSGGSAIESNRIHQKSMLHRSMHHKIEQLQQQILKL